MHECMFVYCQVDLVCSTKTRTLWKDLNLSIPVLLHRGVHLSQLPDEHHTGPHQLARVSLLKFRGFSLHGASVTLPFSSELILLGAASASGHTAFRVKKPCKPLHSDTASFNPLRGETAPTGRVLRCL